MDKDTSNALEASIKHHEENLTMEDPDDINIFSSACALCNLYLYHYCRGCPVYEKGNYFECKDSPWSKMNIAFSAWKNEISYWWAGESSIKKCLKKRTQFRNACRKEIKFLKSLRETKNV